MTYRRTQPAWILRFSHGVGLGVLIAGYALKPQAIVLGIAGVFLPLLWLFWSLTVEADERGIRIAFGPGLLRKRFAWSEIVSSKPVVNPWHRGWGIRWTGSGWMWNASGNQAVELTFRDGRKFRIGTDEPAALDAFIQARLRAAR